MEYNICYLILCHDNPTQVKNVVDFLYADDAYFAIHVDKKAKDDFSIIRNNEHVKFVEDRIATIWGGTP